jgi:C4-dicarboxylate-specific signal transduction histidine kinase
VRLHQLLLNLTSNAIDACIERSNHFHDERSYIVTVKADKLPDNTLISVTDNGCGISNDIAKSLFTNPSSSKVHGLGIGLKTVKTIVEDELGGDIEVKSVIDEGTTFIITLPA